MADFTPNFNKARTDARSAYWSIDQAERRGATSGGLQAMKAERAQKLRAAIFAEAGAAAGAARRAREAVESRYQDKAPSTQMEAVGRLNRFMNMENRVMATRTADLVKKADGMMNDPLHADPEVLAAIGAELRRRGDHSEADAIGGHLDIPVWTFDDEWQEAHDAETMLTKWHEDAARQENPLLPDGSPFSLNDVLEMSARDALSDAGPLPERTSSSSRAAFNAGRGE
ncbi:MAG: hypothetical protein Q7W51_05750 [Coriobacteriia bacterium]|nr:hypothetical protein [Coriobacteriia bacterium]